MRLESGLSVVRGLVARDGAVPRVGIVPWIATTTESAIRRTESNVVPSEEARKDTTMIVLCVEKACAFTELEVEPQSSDTSG